MSKMIILPMLSIIAGFAPISTRLNLRMFDVTLNTNVTTDTELSGDMKTHYQKTLIDMAEPKLLHDRFGQVANIPTGRGKKTEWRYFDPLAKALTPLVEGVSPSGGKLSMHVLDVTPDQYGYYVALSDVLMTTTLDPILIQSTLQLGSQAGRTLDTITREVLAGGSNRIFAPQVVSGTETEVLLRSSINTNCRLTPAVIRLSANELDRMDAMMIDDSWAAIIHPDTVTDMLGHAEWIEAQKYVNPQQIYKGNIGELSGVVFNKTTEAKIIAPADIFTGVCRMSLRTALDASPGSVNILTNEAISVAQAAELNAAIALGTVQIYVGGKLGTLVSCTSGAAGTAKFVVSAAITSVAANAMICGTGAGADGSAVYFTTIIAMNAYGVTALEGLGLQHIVKQLGSGDDPLNQRATAGWKASKAAKRLIEAYMIRIEHSTSRGLTALSN